MATIHCPKKVVRSRRPGSHTGTRSKSLRHSWRRKLAIELLDRRELLAGDTNAGTGLLAQYFNNSDLTNLALVRTDSAINFDWLVGSPDVSIGNDTFSARWSGQVESKFTETYTFYVNADDGARLWVNGKLLIDRWSSTPVVNASANIDFISGRKYDIVLEYFENVNSASIKWEWSSPSQVREVVPTVRLFPSERGSLLREVWTGVSGSNVSDLTGLTSYPATPNTVTSVSAMETTSNSGDNYGQRVRGYLYPPSTGEYSFFVAGDESAELWLSHSSDSASKQRIASVPSSTNAREWGKFPQQRSSVIQLVAGQTYYIEGLHKEATGADHFAVGWMRPGSSSIEVLSGEFLSPVLPQVSLFAEQPTTAEGAAGAATFSVVRTGGPLTNALTVAYTIRGTATNGTDYTLLPGTITIPAGQKAATISIVASNDALTEGPETVAIELVEGVGYEVGRISERNATATIQDNVNAPPGGTPLLTGTSLANFSSFGGTFTTVTDPTYGNVIQAAITNQLANPWDAQLRQSNSSAVSRGDILYAEFMVRSVTPTGNITSIFELNTSPFTKSLDQGLTLNTNWTKVQLRFIAGESYTIGQAGFGFHLGSQIQTLQFANFNVRNYGPSSNLVPASGLVLNNIGGSYGNMQTVPISGQPFVNAYQVNTTTVPANGDNWRLQAVATSASPAQSGDNLRVEFWARSVSGAAPRIGIALQQAFGSFTTLAYNEITPTSTWQKYTYNTVMGQAYTTGQLQVAWNVGFGIQAVQIADVQWTNTTRGIQFAALPERFPPANYGGRTGTDSWRAAADTRIAQNRMANLNVQVKDSNGSPIDGAVVMLQQQKQQFKFGTAINGYNNLLSPTGGADALKYQSEIKRLFNTGVIENNLKWPDFLNNRQLGIDAANWVKNNGLFLRGHNVIWPSRTFMPSSVWSQYDNLVSTQGTAAAQTYLRNTINARVVDAATTFASTAGEWDIVNEPFANNDVMAILGNDELLSWFQLFRTNNASASRTLNDYDIFSRNGGNTAHRANFDYWLGRLVSQNLIETIGEQSHYSDSNLTDIAVLGQLIQSYNTTYQRPIAITEFDVNSKNEQLQADYLRDYMTMVFSQSGASEFLHWGFWSKSHWLPEAALYRDDFSIKPNGQAYEDLVFGDWWTDTRGTSQNGQFQSKAFMGDYKITVIVGGQQVITNATLGANGTTLNVTIPGNRVPTSLSLDKRSIPENSPANTVVGNLLTSDPDSGNTFTYALVGGVGSTDNSLFNISGNQLRASSSLDFETRTAYSVRVRSTDQGGFATESTWTIQVENALETSGLRTDLIVPLYQFPSFTDASRSQLAGWWRDVATTASPTQPITAIINPQSGPFDPASSTTAIDYQIYVDAMRLLRANPNVRIIGYVPTGFSTRSLSQINQFLDWYSTGYKDTMGGSLLDGIFLDEYLGDAASLAYYRSIRDNIRARDYLANHYIMANPGTPLATSTHYTEPVADSFVTYENTESPTGVGDVTLVNSSVPTNAAVGVEFAAIVHSVPGQSDLQRVTEVAKAKGYGQLFVTNDTLPNPFDVVPAYWTSALSELHRPVVINQSMTVAESAAINSLVGIVTAFDPDPGQSLSYAITAGNTGNVFSINGLGEIRIASALDFESLASYALTVQVSDNGVPSLTDTATVNVGVTNVNEPPALTTSNQNVSGNVLSAIANTGTWLDPEGDTVNLTASLGSVTLNANGTWFWTYTSPSKLVQQLVTITGTDSNGASSITTFQVDAHVAVTNSKVYYKGSALSSTSVNNALDTGKLLAQSGGQSQTLSFSNIINWDRGINGLVFDVAGLVSSTLTAADFGFRMSPMDATPAVTNQPSTWTDPVPAPTLIQVTPGTSTVPARVRLEWADNAIANRWLQIRILANSQTGLLNPLVYYIGHLQGDTNGLLNASGYFQVRTDDITRIKLQIGQLVTAASVEDLTKDGKVRTADITAAFNFFGRQLSNITIPAAGSGAEGESGLPLGVAPTVDLASPISTGAASDVRPGTPDSSSDSTATRVAIGVRWTGMNYDVPTQASFDPIGERPLPHSPSESDPDRMLSTPLVEWVDDYFTDLGTHPVVGPKLGARRRF